MIDLPTARLEALRDALQRRGNRKSMVLPSASPRVIEAIEILEEYGAVCEVMYLMMAADKKVLNIERQVLRGALDVLSGGRVRTVHMEAMLDSSARRVAEHGEDRCLENAIEQLRDDPVRAETTVVLAAAVAAADAVISPEEHALFEALIKGLEISEDRAREILDELNEKA